MTPPLPAYAHSRAFSAIIFAAGHAIASWSFSALGAVVRRRFLEGDVHVRILRDPASRRRLRGRRPPDDHRPIDGALVGGRVAYRVLRDRGRPDGRGARGGLGEERRDGLRTPRSERCVRRPVPDAVRVADELVCRLRLGLENADPRSPELGGGCRTSAPRCPRRSRRRRRNPGRPTRSPCWAASVTSRPRTPADDLDFDFSPGPYVPQGAGCR